MFACVISMIWQLTEAPDAPSNLFLRKAIANLFPETFHEDLKDLLVTLFLNKVRLPVERQVQAWRR